MYLLVAFVAQTDELVVLAKHLCAGAREVEAHLGDVGAKVVDREGHLAGQVFLVFPNHPTQAGIDKAVLMAGGADGELVQFVVAGCWAVSV